MKTWPRRVVSLVSLVILLGSAVPMPAAAAGRGPDLMPPHPRLLEEYEAGRMPMPDFIASPGLWQAKGIDSPAKRTSLLGSLNALAVVVDFSDKVKTVTATYFDSMIFAAPVVGRGSVYDYFDEVSYGQIDIVTVNLPSSMGWIRAPSSYATYVNGGYCTNGAYPNNCQKLAEDIVDAVNSVVDFSDYDNDGDGAAEPVMLIHAGKGAEFTGSVNDIWSHSWSLHTPRSYDGVTISDYVIMPEYWVTVSAGTSDMTIGVFAHEMGHGFWGLPDLYDRDYTSSGIGDWSLMAGGSWNGPYPGGASPSWPDAWDRVQMGILSPTNITTNATGRSIPQAYNNPSPAQTVLKLDSAALGAQEYYLLENRQQVSGAYDEYLPGEGLFIWHIDEAMSSYTLWNNYECETQPNSTCSDSAHYLVKLQQADGVLNLENNSNQGDAGDPYPGSTTNRNFTMLTDPESSSYYSTADTCIGVTNISNSLDTMTADLQVSCATIWDLFLPLVLRNFTAPAAPPTAPTGLGASPVSETQINLTWSDLSGDESDFHVERSPNGSSGWTEIGTSPANTPSYSSTGLDCNTPYYYRVRAHRHGDSQYSGFTNTANATTSACVGWTTITSVDFEGTFPGDWDVFDNDGATNGEYYWGKRTCRQYAGSYSGWGVGGGANGSGLGCGANYPDNADGWMVFGPFTLVGATAADLQFKLWGYLESGYDFVCRSASTDGANFYGTCTSGNTGGWIDRILDLSNVYSLGNLLGQSNVWVAIEFYSDPSQNFAEGGYVDNVVLRKCMTGSCPAPSPFVDLPSGATLRDVQRMRIANR
jgi:immune inhibitor A